MRRDAKGTNLLRGAQAGFAAVTDIAFIPLYTTAPHIANAFDSMLHASNVYRRAQNYVKDYGGNNIVGKVLSFLPNWNTKTKMQNNDVTMEAGMKADNNSKKNKIKAT